MRHCFIECHHRCYSVEQCVGKACEARFAAFTLLLRADLRLQLQSRAA